MWYAFQVLKEIDAEMLEESFNTLKIDYTNDPVKLAQILRDKPQGTVFSFKVSLERIAPLWANRMISDVMFCFYSPAMEYNEIQEQT